MNKDNEIYVFLSHSHLDYEKVRTVRNLLEQEGYRPLMFFLKCLENEKYEELTKTLIKEEIDSRQRFILCASEHAKTSDWVKFEINHIVSTNRPYEIIELDAPIEAQMLAVKNFKRRSTVFISAPRQLDALVQMTIHALKKNDFQMFYDKYDLMEGADFASEIKQQLRKSSDNGYVLIFIDENLKENSFQYFEIQCAMKINHSMQEQRVIPIWASQKFDYDELLDLPPIVFECFRYHAGINVCKMDIKTSALTIANRLVEIDVQQNNHNVESSVAE
ncbi:hypothetical protein B5F90_10070 [Alistipes sp. An31A]|uniref:toll/interleukin-1 receptor domain-containing protein n=1 Tax=Alistipes sp. An31A TaxID=1965631 RepID=UPI000B3962A6|nr:toll/interleukin-1 receptor domain-containing protein [Alistipes sp. An31A]OUO18397.1 hypothetical protein B5F90_10070 [Alistipes sp. An31A]